MIFRIIYAKKMLLRVLGAILLWMMLGSQIAIGAGPALEGSRHFREQSAAGERLAFNTGQAENGNGTKKETLERQLAELEKEAAALDKTIQDIQGEAQTLANEIAIFDAEIRRRQLEIRRLDLAIQKARFEIRKKIASIDALSQKITRSRQSLASAVLLIYMREKESIFSVLIKNANLSDFLGALVNLNRLHQNLQLTLSNLKEEQMLSEKEKRDLEIFKKEQEDLKALQEVERRFLEQKKKEKDELLRLTKGKEALFQKLLSAKKKDIASLRTQLFYLEKTGVTAEEAVKFAELASKRAGIRPAFLLALLEVETGKQFEEGVISVGTNVGTGNWKDDMYLCYQRLGRYYGGSNVAKYNSRAEKEKEAFFSIAERLGFDPDKMPVSKEPPYIGCGGAMGPAQFLPSTWLLYEKRVAELTGHNPPNPWNIEDAFTAAAIFLADAGAASQTVSGESRAAKIYLSGSSSCERYVCRSYASRVLSLAREIERIL